MALFLYFCLSGVAYGQGDNPCSALILSPTNGTTCTPVNYSLAGLTSTSTAAATNPTCAGFNPSITPDGWFRFTTTTAQNIFITTTAGSIYDGGMELYVQSGPNCASITSIICDDDSDVGLGFMPQISLLNQPAGTYFIRFWDFEDTNGDFNLCVATTDSGDEPCSAISITPTTGTTCTPTNYSLTGLTSTSSAAASNPTCAGFNPGITPDVWLSFTTTAEQDIFIATTAGSIYDGGMELYVQSGGCASISSIICDDDSDPGPGFMPEINVLNQPAGTYYIRVWDFEDTNGDLNLCAATITPVPANDNCAGAIAFPAIPTDGINCAMVAANTFRATGTADATCIGTEDDDLWYTFTVPVGYSSVIYNMTNISGSNDRVIQLFSNTCPAGASLGCYGAEAGVITGLTGGTTYLMRVYTAGTGVVSNFNICLMLPPINDECSNAISITNASGVFINPGTQYAGIATQSLPPITCNSKTSSSANDVWYKFQPDANGGNIAISVTPVGSADLVIEGFINAGNCNGPSVCADATLDGTETLQMTNVSVHGEGSADYSGTYYFRVYRYNSAAPYSFNITAGGTALPLVLTSFTGQIQDKINVLYWGTLTEKNVQFHIVERSVDGTKWREIGRKNGLLNSSQSVKYGLEDRAPLAKAYYRLRSVDMDGQESLSRSILLVRKGESFGITNIFPSPTTGDVTVQFNAIKDKPVTVQIMDMTGRLVLSQTMEANQELNERVLRLQNLQPGVYTVSIIHDAGVSAPVRLIKQ